MTLRELSAWYMCKEIPCLPNGVQFLFGNAPLPEDSYLYDVIKKGWIKHCQFVGSL